MRKLIVISTPKRTCGSCTMCCKLLGVEELNKQPDVWCPHCKIGKGCKIYDTRPSSCREFECLWLQDEHWPDEVRPDKSRVVMSCSVEGDRLVAYVDPGRPTAHREGLLGGILEMLAEYADIIAVIGKVREVLTMEGQSIKIKKVTTITEITSKGIVREHLYVKR